MTRTVLQLGFAALVGASLLSTPAQAGRKERDFFKKLLFPPIPVPVPGKKKVIDLNEPLRKIKLPRPPKPSIVVPRVSVSVSSRRDYRYRGRDDHHYRSRRQDHHREHRRHHCTTLLFSTDAPPNYYQASCVSPRPTRRHTWIEGHWKRSCCGWQWVGGRWELPPDRYAYWISGSWTPTKYGWNWRDGYWSYPTCY